MKKSLVVWFIIVLAISSYSSTSYAGTEPYIGEITMFAGNFAPENWAFCNGQLLVIQNYTALFSLLGTTYGGDGRTTFGLPDLRGRVPVHPGTGGGLTTRRLGEIGGVERHTLTANEIPSHTHTLRGSIAGADKISPEDGTLSAKARTKNYNQESPDADMNAESISNTGGGQSHYNMQPYLGINFIIALQGTYPPRN